MVVLDRRVTRAVDQVRCDSEAGAYELVHHLTELGHRRIAVITGRRNISTSTDRVMGYERALRGAGLPVDPASPLTTASASKVATDRSSRSSPRSHGRRRYSQPTTSSPSARCERCAKPACGYPTIARCVTFDDLPAESHDDPFMTVINQPAYELGRKATEVLLGRLEGKARLKRQVIVLPGELIVRRSSGSAPVAPPL